jgi:hypothetical protein
MERTTPKAIGANSRITLLIPHLPLAGRRKKGVQTPAPCRYSSLTMKHMGAGRIPHMGQVSETFLANFGEFPFHALG